jgi:hypothetical protein
MCGMCILKIFTNVPEEDVALKMEAAIFPET